MIDMVAMNKPIRTSTGKSAKPSQTHVDGCPKFKLHPDFKKRSAERVFYGDHIPDMNWDAPMDAEKELGVFQAMHYTGYRVTKAVRKRSVTKRQREKEMTTWRLRYEELQDRLVNRNLGLVYEMLRRNHFRKADQDELLSEGLMALLRSVQTFDPWRGFRFSTYACNSILRAFMREAMKETKIRDRAPIAFDPSMEKIDVVGWRRENDRALFAERLNRILDHNEAELSDLEIDVLERRFPKDPDVRRETLDSLGRSLKVSKERVRQIQNGALSKLRETVSSDPILFDQVPEPEPDQQRKAG
jgi:RNA polymerase primary sigma factor